MKRVGWVLMTVFMLCTQSLAAHGLTTEPSNGSLAPVSGPFLITSYSFSGKNVRYIQIHNSSSMVQSLDGWTITSIAGAEQKNYAVTLQGLVEPGKYVTVAQSSVLPTATFRYADLAPAIDPAVATVSLVPPFGSNYTVESVNPTITTTTPRVTGTPATFYFSRNTSSTTGNFLSTFTAFLPSSTYTVISDPLYVSPATVSLSIVEVFADGQTCAPNATSIESCGDYIKIYNSSADDINLSQYRLRTGGYGQVASSTNTIRLTGILPAGHYYAVPASLSASGSWVWFEDAYGMTAYEPSITSWPSSTGHDSQAWSYDIASSSWKWTALLTPRDEPNKFVVEEPVNTCEAIRLSEIAANVDISVQFVEVFNVSPQTVELGGCALQTNRSQTATYKFGARQLNSGERAVVYVRDTALTLTKTTSGTVYLLSSDIQHEVDARAYEDLASDTSYALIDEQWLQTYEITPQSENKFLQYPACATGYERNLTSGLCNKVALATVTEECEEGKVRSSETNRCRTISVAATTPGCDAGEYRNPETNRCRNIVTATASSLLTPCNAGQVRNPETNRCRSIAAEASTLQPCPVNQERNPETNRCRKKTTNGSVSDFKPTQAVAAASGGTVSWWAFGGAATLAAGYAGWEWRREALTAIRRVAGFATSGR